MNEESDEWSDPHLDDQRRRHHRVTSSAKVAQADAAACVSCPVGNGQIGTRQRVSKCDYLSAPPAAAEAVPAGFREDYTGPPQDQFGDDHSDVRGSADLLASGRAWCWTSSVLARATRARDRRGRGACRTRRCGAAPASFAVVALAVGIGVNTGVFRSRTLPPGSLPFHERERCGVAPLRGSRQCRCFP